MDLDALSQQIKSSLHDTARLIEVMQSAMPYAAPISAHPACVLLGARHGTQWNLLSAIRSAVLAKMAGGLGYQYLVPALAHAKGISASELCELVRDLRSVSLWNGWTLREPLIALFQRDRLLGLDCLQHLLSHREEVTDDDVATFAIALGLAQPQTVFEHLLTLCRSSTETDRQAGFIGLRAIVDGGHLEQVSAAAVEVRKIAEGDTQASPAVAATAWDLLCRLAPVEPQAWRLIECSITDGPKEARAAVCYWLSGRPADALDKFGPRLFTLLLDVAIQDADSRREIDGTLGLLLLTERERWSPIELCDALNTSTVQLDLQTHFPRVFAALVRDSATFGRVMSRWLLSVSFSTTSLQSLLQASYLNLSLAIPDVEMFAQADPAARRRALRRMLALAVQAGPVCQWTFHLAQASSLKQWGLEAFQDIFINHLLVELPGPTRQFLIEQQKSLDAESPLAAAVTRVLKSINDWEEVLNSLPKAKELHPSALQRAALRAANLRQHRAMSKDIAANSIWTKIATPLRVKQGRRVISRAPGRLPQPIEMKPYSHSIDLPTSEIADPLLSLHKRLAYLADGQ